MAINSVSSIASTPTVGLDTQTYNVLADGLYTCTLRYTIPYQASGGLGDSTTTSGGSSLQVVVNLNGAPQLTLNVGSPYQATLSGSVQIQCTAGDTITVVPSSAADADNALNAVKGVINVFLGAGA